MISTILGACTNFLFKVHFDNQVKGHWWPQRYRRPQWDQLNGEIAYFIFSLPLSVSVSSFNSCHSAAFTICVNSKHIRRIRARIHSKLPALNFKCIKNDFFSQKSNFYSEIVNRDIRYVEMDLLFVRCLQTLLIYFQLLQMDKNKRKEKINKAEKTAPSTVSNYYDAVQNRQYMLLLHTIHVTYGRPRLISNRTMQQKEKKKKLCMVRCMVANGQCVCSLLQ